jgi:tetratricopeptide (TPR) repeat protein
MKNRILLLMMASGLIATAQLDKSSCPANLSIFAEFSKVKNYDSAYQPWLEVRNNCPELNVATFKYGERILNHKIKNATDDKAALQASLMSLYDDWLTYFPNTKRGASEVGKILSSKAQAMVDNKLGTKREAYEIFDQAFTQDPKSFTSPKHLYTYFKTAYQLYKQGDKTAEVLFDKYEEVSEKFALEQTNLAKKLDVILKKVETGEALTSRQQRNKRVYETNTLAFSTYAGNLDAMISKESSCENLIPLYRKNFEANISNSVWLNRAASRMDAKECADDPLFVELVEALHAINPSANSAYYLGILKDKAGESKAALAYYEESLTLEQDQYRKADILYKIAVKFKKRNLKSKSRSYARKALKNRPSMGKAYMLIASLYAASANDCGNTQFEKRAVYWLAAKTARKAATVDSGVKKTALKLAASYEGRAPSKTDIFTEGRAGETISFSCWINSSVTVPQL